MTDSNPADFKTAFREGCISLDLRSDTKEGIITELVDLLVAAGKIDDRADVLAAILAREQKMSTGMQSGIAIPHARTASVRGLVTAFGLKKEGIDFEALDGQPSRIFVMTISPESRAGPHMKYLAEISRLLNEEVVRDGLLQAQSRDDIIKLMVDAPPVVRDNGS